MNNTLSITVYPDPAKPPSLTFKDIPWFPGITVIQAMVIADAMDPTDFTFRAVFASLFGAFVDAINGLEDQGDNFWMLYVGNVAATVGVSESILIEDQNTGNIDIEWKYEHVSKDHPLRGQAERKSASLRQH